MRLDAFAPLGRSREVAAALAAGLLLGCGGEAPRTHIRQNGSAAASARVEAGGTEPQAWQFEAECATEASSETAPCTADEAEAVRLVNATRAEHDLPLLTIEPGLMVLARDHAALMAAREDLLHMRTNPPAGRKAGAWRMFAENTGTSTSIARVHAALLRSPGHRANILGDFTHLGVGVAEGPGGQLYVMQIFVHE